MSDWAQGKRQQKLASNGGEGWLLSPFGDQVVRISSGDDSLHAKWCEVTDAERDPSGRLQIGHRRRMLRYNAVQLWHNLCRQGWRRIPPQW